MRKWSAWVAVLVVGLAAVPVAIGMSGARAHRDVQRILASLRLPPGARVVQTDPSSGSVLRAPPSKAVVGHLVAVHGFWRVPGDPQRVLAWIEAHAPSGAQEEFVGVGGFGSGVSFRDVGFRLQTIHGSDRALVVTVASARGGGTALRADAQSAPLARRTAAERIRTGVTAIKISERRLGSSSAGPWTVTDRAKVHRIVTLVNGLRLGPAGPIACPADMGPYVTLRFTKAGSTVATAVADGSGCGFVGLSIRGHREPFLAGGAKLISRLSSLLGVSF